MTWAALSLTFRTVVRSGSFPGPHIESPQGESEVVFSNSGICFPPKSTTEVISEMTRRKENKKQGHGSQVCVNILLLENLRDAQLRAACRAGAGASEGPFQRLSAWGQSTAKSGCLNVATAPSGYS